MCNVLSHSVILDSLQSRGLYPTRLLCPWDSPGKNTEVGCHFQLQRIFLTQKSNQHLLCLLHCRWILYLLSHWGSPKEIWGKWKVIATMCPCIFLLTYIFISHIKFSAQSNLQLYFLVNYKRKYYYLTILYNSLRIWELVSSPGMY